MYKRQAQQEAIDLVAADPGLRQPEDAGLRALAEGLFREQTALN